MNIFTYANYKKLLELFKVHGNLYKFNNYINGAGILLRHDVDFDVNKAYILSELEYEMNCVSTYFFLTTSNLYNVNSSSNREMIKKIHNNGFEVGLHFDCQAYGDITVEKMNEKVNLEKEILEDIVGDKVMSISLHAPSIYNQFPKFNGYKNAYSQEYFNSENYFSDSCMDFRGKNIFEFMKNADTSLIQILLHPIHYSESGFDYVKIFCDMFHVRINDLDDYMKIFNKTYKKEIGTNSLFDYISNGETYEI